jgi:predicted PurR-regulated permease PerM
MCWETLMARNTRNGDWQRALILLSATGIGIAIVAALYWAQAIFIPFALAIFLTFILSPFVLFLQKRRLGRIPSVLIAVTVAALFMTGVGWVVARQVSNLASQLPDYSENIKKKIVAFKEFTSTDTRLQKLFDDILALFNPASETRKSLDAAGNKPAPVVVEPPQTPLWMTKMPSFVGTTLEMLGQVALAVVLAVFMLIKREDLRNRFIRLVGNGRMTVTTKAVDEAAQRVSRYLVMQLIINTAYGAALGLGLFFFDVHHSFLWGFIAAVMRYVPYIGAPIAALFPITLSFAMFDGWTTPLLVIGWVVVLELVSNNLMEPWLYGQSIGVSEVAQLIAAAFWAFLWGPIGLVLSGPLTVVMLVLGKYAPQLAFLEILLGDEPPLPPDISYYQRLTAKDQDEATELVLAHQQVTEPECVYDDLLVPALTYARRDRDREGLDEEDEQFILEATREIVTDLGERKIAAAAPPVDVTVPPPEIRRTGPPLRLLACPARDEYDQAALEMFAQLMDPDLWEVRIAAAENLSSEILQMAEEWKPDILCVASLPPGGLARTRYLCKRLRLRFPEVKMVVGRWGAKGDLEEYQKQFADASVDSVETRLLDTRDHLQAWVPVLTHEPVTGIPAEKARREDVAAQARLHQEVPA